MIPLDAHVWMRFAIGLIAGCWVGAMIGGAVALLFASRRIRQLETVNMLLRVKLRAREKPSRTGTGGGPVLVVQPRETNRPASAPMSRFASGDR
ncbi:MAG: hypothetical protein WCA44_14615 [Acidobacteriaceae bacterium]|jgi:hypothetical protein